MAQVRRAVEHVPRSGRRPQGTARASSGKACWRAPVARSSYLCRDLPPPELITSARAVVLAADGVLVVRDPTGVHILPGGRCQPGETLEQTVRREVLEETGWVIDPPGLLGVKHFRHLRPKPAGYRYLYPDFFQVVYGAQAHRFDPGGRETNGYELGAEFKPTAELQRLPYTQASDSSWPLPWLACLARS